MSDARPSFAQPISSKLSRRLAAAADGFRHGKTIWFRARYKPDAEGSYRISKPIESETMPSLTLEDGEGLFGPFRSEAEPRDLKRTPIKNILITVSHPDGREEKVPLEAGDYDAIFWSIAALEKFAIPHYVAFEGLQEAATLKKKFVEGERAYLVAHGPNTEYQVKELSTLTDGGKVFLIEI